MSAPHSNPSSLRSPTDGTIGHAPVPATGTNDPSFHAARDPRTVVVDPLSPPPSAARAGGARGRATVARLMDAARAAIEARSVTGMRIDDVAELANTSHGTMYLYFQDKDDLLDTLVADCEHELAALAAAGPQISRATIDDVRDWTLRVMAALQRHRASIKAALGCRPGFELTELTEPLGAAARAGLTSRDHLDTAAVVDAWLGMVMWQGLSGEPTTSVAHVAAELLLRGVTDNT